MDPKSNEMLFEEVKSFMKVTWDDDDQDILKSIGRTKAYLQGLYGSVPLSFDDESKAKELLLNRCWYEREKSLNDFEKNYKSLLVGFIAEGALKARRVQNETIQ
ncbi:hypothetical protein ABES96_22215 [Bacillus nitratireducens]|uniref:hypothetical protein n=1 Tax=Bacillus nitratireducens TaxID=2026193 RepID=UPI000BF89F66|nr:hypothetical protein CN467_19505 [Bacillus cereus]PFJ42686.1 hypothetical protein COI99_29940 [Bacillus cereus]